MKTLFLMRHGEAMPHSFSGDAARALTEKGQQEVQVVAKGLLQAGFNIAEIWHSPYLRAVQTAQIIAEGLGVERFVENASLTPDSHPSAVIESIREGKSELMIVSHLPLIPELSRLLLGQSTLARFSPASVGLFDISAGVQPKLVSFWSANNWL